MNPETEPTASRGGAPLAEVLVRHRDEILREISAHATRDADAPGAVLDAVLARLRSPADDGADALAHAGMRRGDALRLVEKLLDAALRLGATLTSGDYRALG